MACAEGSFCRLCRNKVSRDVVTYCSGCKKRTSDVWQYAAINSCKLTLGIPVISYYSNMYLVPRKGSACVNSVSPLSTYISIATRLSAVKSVIHFGKPGNTSYPEIIKVTESLLECTVGSTVVAVDFVNNSPRYIYSSAFSGAQEYKQSCHKLLQELMQESSTVCWHWNRDSTATAIQFQGSLSGLWLSYNGCAISKSARISGNESSITGIPLHSDPLSGDTVTFNTGTPQLDVRTALSGPHSNSIKSTASEYLNCVMKDGRCFSCSTICELHNKIKNEKRHAAAPDSRVELTETFARCLEL